MLISSILITGHWISEKTTKTRSCCSLFSICKVVFRHSKSKLFILNLSFNFSESKAKHKCCPHCSSSDISLHSWFCCFSLQKQLVLSVNDMLTWIRFWRNFITAIVFILGTWGTTQFKNLPKVIQTSNCYTYIFRNCFPMIYNFSL